MKSIFQFGIVVLKPGCNSIHETLALKQMCATHDMYASHEKSEYRNNFFDFKG